MVSGQLLVADIGSNRLRERGDGAGLTAMGRATTGPVECCNTDLATDPTAAALRRPGHGLSGTVAVWSLRARSQEVEAPATEADSEDEIVSFPPSKQGGHVRRRRSLCPKPGRPDFAACPDRYGCARQRSNPVATTPSGLPRIHTAPCVLAGHFLVRPQGFEP